MRKSASASKRVMGARTIGAVCGAVMWCAAAAATEGQGGGASTFPIDLPAQSTDATLRAIAKQAKSSIIFDARAVNGRSSRAVSGQLSALEAVTRALDGTGMKAEVTAGGAIVVKPAGSPERPLDPPPRAPSSGAVEADGMTFDRPLAQLDTSLAQQTRSDSDGAPSAPASEAQELEKVEVTGSRLLRVSSEGPLPVNVYRREDIERSGQPDLERFLSSLNEVSVSSGQGSNGSTVGQGTVQLRGLPLGSTLVLINGRRVEAVGSSSGNYFNLNLIPMAAVERVEIVPVGSSAVYGGDALAGVVNVILKKSIDGVSLDVKVGSARGTDDRSLSLTTGGHSDRGSFLVLGSVSKTTPLMTSERAFFRDADYRRYGGVDGRTQGCSPGTVTSTNGANLPGLNSNVAGIPATASGQTLTVADFAATAGSANLCGGVANGNGSTLLHGSEDLAFHGTGEYRLSESWSTFGELTFIRERQSSVENTLLLTSVLVPATNPYNPFGTAVRVTTKLGAENGMTGLTRNTDFGRALAGIRGELWPQWDFEAAVSTSIDAGDRTLPNNTVNTTARTAALAATDPDLALNPFTTGQAASEEVLRSIWSDTYRKSFGRKDVASTFVRGPLLTLPAGKLEALLGAGYARDRYDTSQATSGAFDINGARSASAAYAEVLAPLLRSSTDGGAWNLAALTLASRYDRYSDFGSATTYQAGLEVRPLKTLLLRGSAATSFKPPTLQQLNITGTTLTTELFGLVDPARGGEDVVGGEVVRTTNHNLHPEHGQAYSFGAVWEPQPGSRLGATAWHVKIKDLIALLDPQDAVDNEALFPGFVTRAATTDGSVGAITQVLYSEANFGRVETGGVDVEAAHFWKTEMGRWTLGLNATRTTSYEVLLAPGAATLNRLGTRAADYWSPKWKANLSAGLSTPSWSFGLNSRYLGSYVDSDSSGRKLGNYWIHDLSGSLDLKRLGVASGGFRTARLSVGVVNVLNRLPEYVGSIPYYDVTQADWRGRYMTARFSAGW